MKISIFVAIAYYIGVGILSGWVSKTVDVWLGISILLILFGFRLLLVELLTERRKKG